MHSVFICLCKIGTQPRIGQNVENTRCDRFYFRQMVKRSDTERGKTKLKNALPCSSAYYGSFLIIYKKIARYNNHMKEVFDKLSRWLWWLG